MRTNAILLIDLENFFLGREENVNGTPAPHIYSFKEDLEKLYNFAVDLAGGRRLVVRRAYANFNVWRMTKEGGPKEYYLQPLPNLLMDKGIEPVQVFRFPGGGNKNASDMRLAMDATALLNDQAGVDFFLLVTGDADFIPLVLELKRRGAEVAVIGVMWHTKPVFQRYCDRFEYFEDLVAAQEIEADSTADLAQVRDALQALLARSQPIKFAAVKPLLGRSLNRTFDPTRFDCLDTGDFLRRYGAELGVAVHKGEHDWEITRPGAAGAGGTAENAGPAGAGRLARHALHAADPVRRTDRLPGAAGARHAARLSGAVRPVADDHGMSVPSGGRIVRGASGYLLLRPVAELDGGVRAARDAGRGAARQGGDVSGVQGRLPAVRRRSIGTEPARLQLGAAGPTRPRPGDRRRAAAPHARVHRAAAAGPPGGARLAEADRRRPAGGIAVRPRPHAGTGRGAASDGGQRRRAACRSRDREGAG